MKSLEGAFLTKTDAAVEILRGEIMRGELAPGTPLQQEAIARRLGLSSTPVREAFVVLESEGLVEKRAHHGVAVAQRDPNDLLDVYEIRLTLEMTAFRRAMQHVTDDLLAQLQESLAEAERSVSDMHVARRANARFHDALVQASRSTVYVDVLHTLIQRSLYAVPLSPKVLADFIGDHRRVVRALRAGDTSSAEKTMSEHLSKMTQMLRITLDRERGADKDDARARQSARVAAGR